MIAWLRHRLAPVHRDNEGAAFILATVALPIIFGMAAFSIDLGFDHYIRNRLQTAADLAALAGSSQINKGTATVAKDTATSLVNTNLSDMRFTITKNVIVTCEPALLATLDCSGPSKSNAVWVELTATVPSFFASALGFGQTTITANAFAMGAGSILPPLNIAFVVDTTSSMINDNTTSCGGTSMTKLACAKLAMKGMLETLNPDVNHVALLTFPLTANRTAADKHFDISATAACGGSNCPSTSPYSAWSPTATSNVATYTVIADSFDFGGSAGLNKSSSTLVRAVGAGDSSVPIVSTCKGPSCPKKPAFGIQAPGGQGTYYADAITAAQKTLDDINAKVVAPAQQRQNVIILLTDGDAYGNKNTTGKSIPLCLEAMKEADKARDRKTWVYAVAYEASVDRIGSCKQDNGARSACETLKAVADPNRFYSTDSSTTPNSSKCQSSNPTSDLAKIFKNISVNMMRTRRIKSSVCTTCQ